MDFTEKDLKKKLKTELVQIAKTKQGYKPKKHSKKKQRSELLKKSF